MEKIQKFWINNQDRLGSLIFNIHQGLEGFIKKSTTSAIFYRTNNFPREKKLSAVVQI